MLSSVVEVHEMVVSALNACGSRHRLCGPGTGQAGRSQAKEELGLAMRVLKLWEVVEQGRDQLGLS